LIGGFAGAAIAHAGFGSINWSLNGGISLTLIFILLAPIIGMIISIFITLVTIQRNFWLKILIIVVTITSCLVFIKFKKPFEFWALLVLGIIFIVSYFYNHIRKQTAYRTANMYKRLQLVSSASFSLGHGGSDAQKAIGNNRGGDGCWKYNSRHRPYSCMGAFYVLYSHGVGNDEWWVADSKNNGYKDHKSNAT
jgi:PiT family inorganic phosphate transporter